MKKINLGILTIGQSPRPDIVPEFAALLGDSVEVLEAGALDGLNGDEIEAMKPRDQDTLLITRLADGSFVTVAEHLIVSCLELQAKKLFERGVKAVVLLCTGAFPGLKSDGWMIHADVILVNAVAALGAGRRLGVLCPEEEQFGWMRARWQGVSQDIYIQACLPSDSPVSLVESAQKLEEMGAELIVMDCMGYTLKMQAEIRPGVKVPVILAKSLVASVVRELWS